MGTTHVLLYVACRGKWKFEKRNVLLFYKAIVDKALQVDSAYLKSLCNHLFVHEFVCLYLCVP